MCLCSKSLTRVCECTHVVISHPGGAWWDLSATIHKNIKTRSLPKAGSSQPLNMLIVLYPYGEYLRANESNVITHIFIMKKVIFVIELLWFVLERCQRRYTHTKSARFPCVRQCERVETKMAALLGSAVQLLLLDAFRLVDVVRTTWWTWWNWASEWWRTSLYTGLVWGLQKLLVYWDFHSQPSLGFTDNAP